MDVIEFANLKFRGLTKEILLKEEKDLKIIITVNADFIATANKNQRFQKLINDNYATFDGQIPYFLAKRKNYNVYFEKISGSDFIYNICEYSKNNNKRVFLLGGLEESNRIAVEKLTTQYGISIDGFSPEYKPYPFDKVHNDVIIGKIKNFKPDFLLVAFGAKKQELWIDDNKEFLQKNGIKWAIGCGGTFELIAGYKKRAPEFIQKIGLEGVYRFLKEPKWFRLKRLLRSFYMFKYI